MRSGCHRLRRSCCLLGSLFLNCKYSLDLGGLNSLDSRNLSFENDRNKWTKIRMKKSIFIYVEFRFCFSGYPIVTSRQVSIRLVNRHRYLWVCISAKNFMQNTASQKNICNCFLLFHNSEGVWRSVKGFRSLLMDRSPLGKIQLTKVFWN